MYLNNGVSGINICDCGILYKQNLGDAGHAASLYKPLRINNESSVHPIKSTDIKATQEITGDEIHMAVGPFGHIHRQ